MAYLDEDVIYNNIKEKYKVAKGEARKAYSDVLDTICEMPRADVVPKSEVERLEHILDCYALQYGTVTNQRDVIEKAKAEVAREIFEEIEKHLVFNAYGIAVISDKTFEEIKNKYMGVRNDR